MADDWRDPLASAESLGAFPRQAPAEQWGNGQAGRAGTAIAWSSRTQVPIQGGNAAAAAATQPQWILTFNAPSGMPSLWNVALALRAALDGGNLSPARKNVWVRLRWSIGSLASEADADLASATASFQLAADQIQVGLFNFADAKATIDAAVAVCPAAQVAAARTARRTLTLASGIVGATVVIPPWSQQMQVVPESGAPGAWSFTIRDAAAVALQTVYVDTTVPDYPLIELPCGAFDVIVATAAAAPKVVAYMFVLGF